MARIGAAKAGSNFRLWGGYEGAEREMACFFCEEEGCFPIAALTLRWPHQQAPTHRDILGSVLGLGLERDCVGDVVLQADEAYLFAERTVAQHIADSLLSAGRVRLQVELAEQLPQLEAAQGVSRKDTVHSLRLDAILATGLCISRGKAVQLIEAGRVKLRHVQTLRVNAQVQSGDMISIRGMGRLQLTEAGAPNRKGRLPITVVRFGIR